MKPTNANKGADMLAPRTAGRRYRAVSPGEASIKWTRSPSGATHTGTAGAQRFQVMPDGTGGWLLTEIDAAGTAHLLEHSLSSDWSAMAAALDYVQAPLRWPVRVLAVCALLTAVGVIHAIATL